MINICKFCEHKIPTAELADDWWCPKCQKYSIRYLDNGVESEVLRAGNFYIIFFPTYKTASIVSTDDDMKIFRSFEMDKLTQGQALYWDNKLKTYVLFQ